MISYKRAHLSHSRTSFLTLGPALKKKGPNRARRGEAGMIVLIRHDFILSRLRENGLGCFVERWNAAKHLDQE